MNNIGTVNTAPKAYIIFAIDGEEADGKVFRATLSLQYKIGNMRGKCIQCVGSWKGVEETSYIMREDDFNKFVRGNWVKKQEAIMRIYSGNRQAVELIHTGGKVEHLGFLRQVNEETARKEDGWTYRPDLDIYWITVKGNPDVIYGSV